MTIAGMMKMPFGSYKGKTLDEIAEEESGLIYLDWLREQIGIYESISASVKKFVDAPDVAGPIKAVIEKRRQLIRHQAIQRAELREPTRPIEKPGARHGVRAAMRSTREWFAGR